MATDATGTPTAKGIPKYNLAVDPPSGRGFNAAMDALDALFDDYVASPASIATGEVPVWNGTAWARSSVTRVTTVRPQDLTQDAATSGQVLTWNGSIWAPDDVTAGETLLEHTEITSNVNVTGTAYNAGTAVIAGTARTYTAVPHLIEFYSPRIERTVASGITVGVFDGTTHIGNLAYYSDGNGGHGTPCYSAIRITPSAASHTYNIKAWGNSTTVYAGTGGGSDAYCPAFMRITIDLTV